MKWERVWDTVPGGCLVFSRCAVLWFPPETGLVLKRKDKMIGLINGFNVLLVSEPLLHHLILRMLVSTYDLHRL